MNLKLILNIGAILICTSFNLIAQTEKPIVTDKLVFEEQNGSVAVEAEFFVQTIAI